MVSTKIQRLIVKPWALPVTVPAVVIANFLAELWRLRHYRSAPVIKLVGSNRITVARKRSLAR